MKIYGEIVYAKLLHHSYLDTLIKFAHFLVIGSEVETSLGSISENRHDRHQNQLA